MRSNVVGLPYCLENSGLVQNCGVLCPEGILKKSQMSGILKSQ